MLFYVMTMVYMFVCVWFVVCCKSTKRDWVGCQGGHPGLEAGDEPKSEDCV